MSILWNLEHFQKKYAIISEIMDCKGGLFGFFITLKSEILRLFLNNNKYSRCNETSSNAIIKKAKDFFWIFYYISEMCMKFRTVSKKRWVS